MCGQLQALVFVCRGVLISEQVAALRNQAVTASLQQSVADLQSGEGSAGAFLRFARRTIVRDDRGASRTGTEAQSTTMEMQPQELLG